MSHSPQWNFSFLAPSPVLCFFLPGTLEASLLTILRGEIEEEVNERRGDLWLNETEFNEGEESNDDEEEEEEEDGNGNGNGDVEHSLKEDSLKGISTGWTMKERAILYLSDIAKRVRVK